MPADVKATAGEAYDEKFRFLFDQLAIGDTREIVAQLREAAGAAPADAGRCDAGARRRAGRRGPVGLDAGERRARPMPERSGWRRSSARSAARRTT